MQKKTFLSAVLKWRERHTFLSKRTPLLDENVQHDLVVGSSTRVQAILSFNGLLSVQVQQYLRRIGRIFSSEKHHRSLRKDLTCREGQLCVDHIHKHTARRLDHNVLSTKKGNDYQACLRKVKHFPNVVYLVLFKIKERSGGGKREEGSWWTPAMVIFRFPYYFFYLYYRDPLMAKTDN